MLKWLVVLSIVVLLGSRLAAAPPDAAKSAEALKALGAALDANRVSLADLGGKDFAGWALTREDAAMARRLIWQTHAARIQKERAAEVTARVLKDGKLEMPFFFKTFGKKPADGRSLWPLSTATSSWVRAIRAAEEGAGSRA